MTDATATGEEDPPADDGGVDTDWVMQVTFVVTILVGAPLVGILGAIRPPTTWAGRAEFAIRVGAVVWLVTALGVYAYARQYRGGQVGAEE